MAAQEVRHGVSGAVRPDISTKYEPFSTNDDCAGGGFKLMMAAGSSYGA